MKRYVLTVSILILVSSALLGFEKSFLKEESEETKKIEQSIEIKLNINKPIICESRDEKYIVVKLKNTTFISNPGEPMIPCYNKVLAFPLGTKIENISIKFLETKEIKISGKIMPAQQPIPLNRKEHKIKIFEKKEIYESNETYPKKWIEWHTGGGLHNGEHVTFLSLHIYPIRYIPKESKLIYIENGSIKVEYNLPEKLFITTNMYSLLIISSPSFVEPLKKLVTHKNNIGISTILVTTDEIKNNEYFKIGEKTDFAEKTKYFIKEAIENWGIEYVLFVGGLNSYRLPTLLINPFYYLFYQLNGIIWCPPLYSYFACEVSEWYWLTPVRYSACGSSYSVERFFLSDLYFADVYDASGRFCSWDSDSDCIFGNFGETYGGESIMDMVDLYPDVYVGRLACRNIKEVETVVDKIINYENNAYGKNWFKKIILCGGDSYKDDNRYMEGQAANEIAYNYIKGKGFETVKLWENDLTRENFIEKQNEGSGFTFLSGHGETDYWFTHPLCNDFSSWVYIRTIDFRLNKLNNMEKLPIIVVGGCFIASFDCIPILDYPTRECWAWTLVARKNGGSIATIGDSALEYGLPGEYFTERYGGYIETHFFEIYGSRNINILGNVWGEEITDYCNKFKSANNFYDYKAVEEWTLLGDPTLMIGGYP